jgi:hypothetical protein
MVTKWIDELREDALEERANKERDERQQRNLQVLYCLRSV